MASTRELILLSDLSSLDFTCSPNGLRVNWTIVDNGDGLITLQDGLGNIIATVSKSDLTDNGDGTFTFTNNDGSDVTFNANSIVVQSVNKTDAEVTGGSAQTIATHTNAGGVSTTINETVTQLPVNNGDGSITFFDETGNSITINALNFDMDVTEVQVNGSVITFVGEGGQPDVVVDICTMISNCNISAIGNVSSNTDAPVDCAFMVYNQANAEWEAVDLSTTTLDCTQLGTH